MAKFAVILPAAGRSSRFKNKHYKKPFAPLANRAVWIHSAERFLNRDDVGQLILVIAPEDRDDFNFKFASNVAILGIDVVEGGAERADSVEAALAVVKPEADFICVHDAARPCLADVWIDRVFEAARRDGAAILAVAVANTLKRVLRERAAEGTTIFMSTHALSVAEETAERVGIIQKGRLVALGSLEEIKLTARTDGRLEEAFLRLTEESTET